MSNKTPLITGVEVNSPQIGKPNETLITNSELAQRYSILREDVGVLSEDIREGYQSALIDKWKQLTLEHSKKSVQHLLEIFAEKGFSWNDIARLCGVSVPAVRKWRNSSKATPDNRKKLAALLAACDILNQNFNVEEEASWFEMAHGEAPVTPMDLYCDDRIDLVFELARATANPDNVMDTYDPHWRDQYNSPFNVVVGEDGALSLQYGGDNESQA